MDCPAIDNILDYPILDKAISAAYELASEAVDRLATTPWNLQDGLQKVYSNHANWLLGGLGVAQPLPPPSDRPETPGGSLPPDIRGTLDKYRGKDMSSGVWTQLNTILDNLKNIMQVLSSAGTWPDDPVTVKGQNGAPDVESYSPLIPTGAQVYLTKYPMKRS